MQKHITGVHLGLKEFGCTHCSYRSSSKSNVDVHVKHVHLKESKTGYKCSQCGFVVNRRSKLVMHTKRVHGVEVDQVYAQACEQICSEDNEDEDNDEVIEVSPNIIECIDEELEDEYDDYYDEWEEEEEVFIEEEEDEEDEEFEYDESEAQEYASFLDAQLEDIPDVVRVINLGGVVHRGDEVDVTEEDLWAREKLLAEAMEKVSRLKLTLTRTLLIPLTLPLSTEAVELLRSAMPQSPREPPPKRVRLQAKRRRRGKKKKRVAKSLSRMTN